MGFNFASYGHPAYFDHKCLPDKIKSNHSFKDGTRDALKPRIFSTTLNHPPPPKSCLDLKLSFFPVRRACDADPKWSDGTFSHRRRAILSPPAL